MTQPTPHLLERRAATIGPYSPLFYPDAPLELVSGEGVWLTDSKGERYLDGYNNVPHVGHANPRVAQAIAQQAATLNINTRYLNRNIVEYSENLLGRFPEGLNRVFYGNSGSEANELALRIARQLTGHRGLVVSDHSYHGTTITLEGMTTGLQTAIDLDPWVRPVRVPDLDADPRPEAEVLADALAQVDEAIASLEEAGHGVSATLFDPLFSTEGMPRLPQGYVEGLTSRVRKAGGMIIADEVQSGFGRTGTHMWGFQAVGMDPDLVTMGKPMGNGHPVSAVVTSEAVLDAFGSSNEFFNTFAGNPVSAAAAQAVLEEMDSEDLMGRARAVSAAAREELARLVDAHDFLSIVRGQGMFMGIDFTVDGEPRTDLARAAVQGMKERHVLISKIGRHENVLKMRPPLAFGLDELPVFLQALGETLDQIRV